MTLFHENKKSLLSDTETNHFTQTNNGELKGIIMYFSKEGIPIYIYKPLNNYLSSNYLYNLYK